MIPAIYYNIVTTSLIAFVSLAIFLRSFKQRKNGEILSFGFFWLFSSAAYFLTLYLDLAYLYYQTPFFQSYQTMAILTQFTVPLMGLGLFFFIFGPYLKTRFRMIIGLIVYSIGPIYFLYCVFFQDWAEVLISRWGIDYRPPILAIVPFLILVPFFLSFLLIQIIAYLKKYFQKKILLPERFWANLALIIYLVAGIPDEVAVSNFSLLILGRMFILTAAFIAFFAYNE